jgi:hypothetical protein
MSDRFVSTFDEAQSLLMEAIWENYASGGKVTEILLGLEAINALRANSDITSLTPRSEVFYPVLFA